MPAPAGQQVSDTPVGRGGNPALAREQAAASNSGQSGSVTPDTQDGIATADITGSSVWERDIGNTSPRTRGPLAALAQNKYFTTKNETLVYPEGRESFPHYLRFYINQPGKSQFNTTFQNNGNQSISDQNRNRFGQIGGEADPFQGSAIAGGVITGGIYTASQIAADIARASNDGAATRPAKELDGTLVGGVLAGGIAATVLANIDLTRKTSQLKQVIELYVPDQVVMQQQNKYGEVSLTAALGLAGLAGQGSAAVGSAIKDKVKSALKGLGIGSGAINGTRDTRTGLTAGGSPGPFIAETAANVLGGAGKELGIFGEGIENVFLQSYGIVQNPQVEVLFDTVDNRSFEFSFKFHPRSAKEAETVSKIIRMFRFHSAPELAIGTGGRYFVPPSEFDIEYRFRDPNGNDSQNEALHKFATCVLEAVDVDYVGESGQFVTFEDGRPVNTVMRLRFKEVEIIHKQLVEAGY